MTLLLTVIATHALVPLRFNLEPASGSAFSAATAEVAIGSNSRQSSCIKSDPNDDNPGLIAHPPEPIALDTVQHRPFMNEGFGATGPPTFHTTCSPLHPRAPPAT
ncbi:hypothetical protein [Croceicoccus estronivorus]|uniref:hypothetical protein n=1 Tax=Croceicoccus estronivorus TaxID=1172626 RepID=UPI0012E7FAC6|nr:hypothetical protein [Croceicoccus estronivorus]